MQCSTKRLPLFSTPWVHGNYKRISVIRVQGSAGLELHNRHYAIDLNFEKLTLPRTIREGTKVSRRGTNKWREASARSVGSLRGCDLSEADSPKYCKSGRYS
jgi:hypothetical protein